MEQLQWSRLNPPTLGMAHSVEYICGYCGREVGSVVGDSAALDGVHAAVMRICPNCGRPTLIDDTEGGVQTPASLFGDRVDRLPDDVGNLYRQARASVGNGSHHAAVLVARTLLMHIAVNKGAAEGESFLGYVDYLVNEGHVPPSARTWVDEIRRVGNRANHSVAPIAREEAETMVDFVSMLLKLTYEYPARASRAIEATEAAAADGSTS